MPETLLRTKLFVPSLRPNLVSRPHLINRLIQDLQLGHKLTHISAPAGFGKSKLVSEWVASCQRSAAWLSLDDGHDDSTRFLTDLVAALQTIVVRQGTVGNFGEKVLGALQSSQPPPTSTNI